METIYIISILTYTDQVKYWDGADWTYNKQMSKVFKKRKDGEKELSKIDTKAMVLPNHTSNGFIW